MSRQLAVLSVVLGFSACSTWVPNRVSEGAGTVGEEVYGVLCDRIVAQNIPEDLGGAQYHSTCHKDYYGNYAKPEQVEATTYKDPGQEANRLARGRVSALANRRPDLIEVFDTVFANQDAGFLADLKAMLVRMTPLYDHQIPNFTNTLAQALTSIDASSDARQGLTRVLNHTGYNQSTSTGGLLAAIVSQDSMPKVLDDTYRLFGVGAANEKTLKQFLFALQVSAQQAPSAGRDAASQSNILASVLTQVALKESPDLAGNGPSVLTAKRDACGMVAFSNLVSPYVSGADGCAQTDPFGRFIDAKGQLINAPAPFVLGNLGFTLNLSNQPCMPGAIPDANGNCPLLYQYVDSRDTVLSGLVQGVQPSLKPGQLAVMGTLSELGPVMGNSTTVTVAHGLVPETETVYDINTSPALDMALALAPVLRAAANNNFAPLTTLAAALQTGEHDSARLLAAIVNAKNLANADTFAKYKTSSTMWDEIDDALVGIADAHDKNGQPIPLLEEMLAAFADPNVVYLAGGFQGLLTNKDQIDMDPANPDKLVNLSDSSSPTNVVPHIGVDRSQPNIQTSATNDNRSLFQRSLGMIHEARGVTVCNKQGASLGGTWNACELFKVNDAAVFLLDTVATGGDPSSAAASIAHMGSFPIVGGVAAIQGLLAAKGLDTTYYVNSFSDLMSAPGVSGINQLSYYPSPQAMSRMIFNRDDTSPYGQYIATLSDPAPSALCPLDARETTDPKFGMRTCSADGHDTMRQRWASTIFSWESNNFYKGFQPVAKPFVMHSQECLNADGSGRVCENLLLDLFTAMHRHWASPLDTSRTSNPGDITYSSGSNMASYEPLLANILAPSSDLIASAQTVTYDLQQTPGGAAAITPLARAFLSRHQNTDLVDRRGFQTTTRNDGTQNSFMTPALLFVQALSEIDTRRQLDPAGTATWYAARGQLVDAVFQSVRDNPSDPTSTHLTNEAVAKALPLFLLAARDQFTKQADFPNWTRTDFQSATTSLISSPATSALSVMAGAIHGDSVAENDLLSLLSGALDPSNGQRFTDAMQTLANLLQALNDSASLEPVLHAASNAFDPESGAAKMSLELLEAARAVDPNGDLSQIVTRLATPLNGQARTPLDVLSDTIVEVQRADPTLSTPLSDADTKHLLEATTSFLTDPQHGLDQLITIMQRRTLQ